MRSPIRASILPDRTGSWLAEFSETRLPPFRRGLNVELSDIEQRFPGWGRVIKSLGDNRKWTGRAP